MDWHKASRSRCAIDERPMALVTALLEMKVAWQARTQQFEIQRVNFLAEAKGGKVMSRKSVSRILPALVVWNAPVSHALGFVRLQLARLSAEKACFSTVENRAGLCRNILPTS